MKKQKQRLPIILCIATLANFTLLFTQTIWHPIPMQALQNDNLSAPKPQFTCSNLYNGSFQNELNEYLKEHYAFREFLTRLFNQYRYTCFNKSCNLFFMPGKDHWMYYSPGVYDYYGLEAPKFFKSSEELTQFYDDLMVKLVELRSILKDDYGIELLSFIGPDKPFIYPEHLPKMKRDATLPHAASYYSQIAEAAGFPNINMTPWFQVMADTSSRLLFMPMDSHWQYAAVYGYDSLFRFMDGLNNFGIPRLKINGISESEYTDLQHDEKIINLLFKVKNETPKYKIDVSVIADSTSRKPKVLFVGDSFFFALEEELPLFDIISYYELWWYNEKSIRSFEEQHYKLEDINRLRSILKVDYVVLYSVGYNWYKEAHPFINDAWQSIKDPEQVKVALMMNKFESDTNRMQKIRKEAKDNGVSVEKMLELEAKCHLGSQNN